MSLPLSDSERTQCRKLIKDAIRLATAAHQEHRSALTYAALEAIRTAYFSINFAPLAQVISERASSSLETNQQETER